MPPAPYRPTSLHGVTDLTLIAPIRDGTVGTLLHKATYAERLRRVLRTLNAVRQASRESERQPSPFADSIGRFLSIHFFRFAVVPADRLPSAGPHQLVLNVTFDGGWESYMRIVWGPLGTLLDLIFCHCETYPAAFTSSFDDYMDWVRKHEVPSDFFYADSAATVGDQRYWERAAMQLREQGDMPGADHRAATLAVPPRPAVVVPTPQAVEASLRVLASLFDLRRYFPLHEEPFLRRFAVDLLDDLRRWVTTGEFDPGGPFAAQRSTAKHAIEWLAGPRERPHVQHKATVPRDFALDGVQGGIARPFAPSPHGVHGAIVLLAVKDAAAARAWLGMQAFTSGDVAAVGALARTVAITRTGLAALGLPAALLAALPQEFLEGMEERAGVLGDARGNHPKWWRRPRPAARRGAIGPEIDLASAHVVLQLRSEAREGERPQDGGMADRLQDQIDALAAGGAWSVLHALPTHNAPPSGRLPPRDHFGYVDGISQPTLAAQGDAAAAWSDVVPLGELFVGRANSRLDGDGVRHPWMQDGTFLVLRVLRMHPERLDAIVRREARRLAHGSASLDMLGWKRLIRAKLMGRHDDGRPLTVNGRADSNDFNFRLDGAGAVCPLGAHVRLANPREPRPLAAPPRIARRGMSWRNASDGTRGLAFMACNASLAEQFEIIQRWLAGGNSTGLDTAASDPFVGVPVAGQRRIFRFVHEDEVVRIDLGDRPLSELDWGLYAFMPSLAKLRELAVEPPAEPPPAQASEREKPDRNRIVERLDSDTLRSSAWAQVRAVGGVASTEAGVLVGCPMHVRTVLSDDGSTFSTGGYGVRMKESIGRGYLGQDNTGGSKGHAEPYVAEVNAAIADPANATIAREAARAAASKLLRTRPAVHFEGLAGCVIGAACAALFGVPDRGFDTSGGTPGELPAFPFDLLLCSRYVFAPSPASDVEAEARKRGPKFLAEVERALADGSRPARAAPLTAAILAAIPGDPDLQARTVCGAMFGLPGTVFGNLVTVFTRWSASRELFSLQQAWFADRDEGAVATAILRTMRGSPVPFMDWRLAAADTTLGGVAIKKGDTVIVGLGSAVEVEPADSMLMFGGEYGKQGSGIVHPCPGRELALAAMLGTATALFECGDLRPTANPLVLERRPLPAS